MQIIIGILQESFELFRAMAPFLLFGFLAAGIIHIFLDAQKVSNHLGHGSFSAVLKASLFGIPLPLCSCGVIPTALSIRKQGASRGAVLSFLISTPTTGVDSILATYALMGGFFCAYRIVATFVTALIAGVFANIFLPRESEMVFDYELEKSNGPKLAIWGQLKEAIRYSFFGKLMEDTAHWLILGILIGGLISYFVPDDFIGNHIGNNLVSILVMIIVGIPMYICSTGSLPIAAALLLKGLNPGAAFAFLVAGPATNTVTMLMVYTNLGKRAFAIYIGSIFASCILLGLIFDYLVSKLSITFTELSPGKMDMFITPQIELFALSVLIILLLISLLKKMLNKS